MLFLSTENKKNRINEAAEIDKRTVGYRRRKLSMEKGTHAILTLLETAKKLQFRQNNVLLTAVFISNHPSCCQANGLSLPFAYSIPAALSIPNKTLRTLVYSTLFPTQTSLSKTLSMSSFVIKLSRLSSRPSITASILLVIVLALTSFS